MVNSQKDKSGERAETWFVAFVLFIVVLAGIVIGHLVSQGIIRSGINTAADSNGQEPAK